MPAPLSDELVQARRECSSVYCLQCSVNCVIRVVRSAICTSGSRCLPHGVVFQKMSVFSVFVSAQFEPFLEYQIIRPIGWAPCPSKQGYYITGRFSGK